MLTFDYVCTITATCDVCGIIEIVHGKNRLIAEGKLQQKKWTFFKNKSRCPRHKNQWANIPTAQRNRDILDLVDGGEKTYAQIGEIYGISKQRVDQIYRRQLAADLGVKNEPQT